MDMRAFKRSSLNKYKKLRNERIYCPAFNEEIKFTLMGWNHIVGNSSKHRSLADVSRRLKLLPLAKKIIQNAGTFQSVRTVNGQTMYGLDSIETIEINGNKILTKVRVIIVDTKTGKKFLSIMDRKLK